MPHSEPRFKPDQTEFDRMLLRGDITLREHKILDNWFGFLQSVRFFNLPAQTFEVKSHSSRSDNIGSVHNWHLLSRLQELFREAGDEVNSNMMSIALDESRDYDIDQIRIGIAILEKADW